MTKVLFMKTIGKHLQLQFPEDQVEARTWTRVTGTRALSRRVLCVATSRIEGAWAAYIKEVPGQNHEHERDSVLHDGDKLPQDIANIVFPRWSDIPYAR